MIAVGIEVPSYSNAAYHIVAGGSQKAEKARQVLEHWGIDINDPANGVFLSIDKKVVEGIYHPSFHTNNHYREVNERIVAAGGQRRSSQ